MFRIFQKKLHQALTALVLYHQPTYNLLIIYENSTRKSKGGPLSMLTGTAALKNTKQYPFNNSMQTIALQTVIDPSDYTVLTEILSADGEVGDITVSGKAINGFKLAYTGSARQAVIRYTVIGGLDHDC
jgi:hypothetical protein